MEFYERLQQYGQGEDYPFHMPGHKRLLKGFTMDYRMDITEIEGFDNLHKPEGIIQEAQQKMAEWFGAEQSYFLVNGSTCGILSAVSAAANRGETVLVARNCHKSVYHALFLCGLKAVYLYPEFLERFGINGAVTPQQVRRKLTEEKGCRAVILVSPTYEGVVSDIAAIAEVVHAFGIPLIVDEAHGAHFTPGQAEGSGFFPESAVMLGADVVIHSLHKTLPSPTQTALLHRNGRRIEPERLEKYLAIYQTTSPSYLFLAAMDYCRALLVQDGVRLFQRYRELLSRFYQETACFQYVEVLTEEAQGSSKAFRCDPSKLLVRIRGGAMTEPQLYQKLIKDWHLMPELAAPDYVLFMTSVLDSPQGFKRLTEALLSVEQELIRNEGERKERSGGTVWVCEREEEQNGSGAAFYAALPETETVLTIEEAENQEQQEIMKSSSAGRICASYICPYPPGIPLLVPGERIVRQHLEMLVHYEENGLSVQGLSGSQQERIRVIKEEI